MSGYGMQEGEQPNIRLSHVNRGGEISAKAANALLRQAQRRPNGGEASFLLDAAANGWKIDFPHHNGQVIGYDDLISNAEHAIEDADPHAIAFGQLVLTSLQPNLLVPDNGK